MLYKNHPSLYAIETELTDHYFADEQELEDFAKGMLVGGHTEFKLYYFEDGDWIEQDWCPYDFYASVDETPYPVAHGQFLAALRDKVDAPLIWLLGQGEKEALDSVNDANHSLAVSLFNRLEGAGAWDELNDELEEEELTPYVSAIDVEDLEGWEDIPWTVELDV